MNIIVTNKCRGLIYSANLEVLKEITGVFKVSEIGNMFNSIFYKKIIIDATAIYDFPKDNVMKELISTFDADKLILFLPPDNPPPRKFLSFLVSINLYNFTDNVRGLIELTKRSNTYENVANYIIKEEKIDNENKLNEITGKIVIGFRSITTNSYITDIIYLLNICLENKHHKNVIGIEMNTRNFVFYNLKNLFSVEENRVKDFINSHNECDIVLLNLDGSLADSLCDEIIYLVNPSLFEINKLLLSNRNAFRELKGKKVMLVNSLLTSDDIKQFAKEASINVYYNMPPLNDRIDNSDLDKLLIKMGIIEESNKSTKKGLFDIFK